MATEKEVDLPAVGSTRATKWGAAGLERSPGAKPKAVADSRRPTLTHW